MPEQKRKRYQERPRRKRSIQSAGDTVHTNATHREAEERLNMLDAAIDDLVNNRVNATEGESMVAGEQLPHQTKSPLSDETVVKRFIQTSGE